MVIDVRPTRLVGAFLAATLLPVVSHAETPEQELKKKIVGVWDLTVGVNSGEPLTENELEGTTVVVEKLTFVTYDKDENERYRATYILDASTDPIQITMTSEVTGRPPVKSLGILRFEDEERDRMTLCYALPGKPRPQKFESEEGSDVLLFRMKRHSP